MATDCNYDLISIKEWLAKENHLPQDIDDFVLKKFLHSCYGSLEQTKKCLEKFCMARCDMPEIYSNRDPLSNKMQDAFSITCMGSYKAANDEILIHQLDDPNLEKFDYYSVLKTFVTQADHWIRKSHLFPEGHILLLDIKNFYLRILPKEAMPVRIKQIHIFNCPSYYEKLFILIKPVLPQEICDLITFHPNVESLYTAIDKVYLPEELGGEAGSMKKQHDDWIKEIIECRDMFRNDNLWKANPAVKSKPSAIENSMNGSFRTLSID